MPLASLGSVLLDNKNLTFSAEEYENAITEAPELDEIFKKIVGSNELIKGINKYVLWMDEKSYNCHKDNRLVSDRVNKVKEFRENAGKSARECADTPYRSFNRDARDNALRKHYKKILVKC